MQSNWQYKFVEVADLFMSGHEFGFEYAFLGPKSFVAFEQLGAQRSCILPMLVYVCAKALIAVHTRNTYGRVLVRGVFGNMKRDVIVRGVFTMRH